MFCRCGSVEDSRTVFFDRIQHQHRDVVSWTKLILGHSENGEAEMALELFRQMRCDRCAPNGQACVALAARAESKDVDEVGGKLVKLRWLEQGMAIHVEASELAESVAFPASSLVEMYSKCGSLVDARRVFDKVSHHDSVLWTVLLLGHADNGEEELTLDLFRYMDSRGCTPDCRTFVAALKACGGVAAREVATNVDGKFLKAKSLERAATLHQKAFESGFESDVFVASSLVDVYAKCCSMVDARRVFDGITSSRRDVVLWTSLMLGYADNGLEEVALKLLGDMQAQGSTPNRLTFVAALKACSGLAAKEEPKLTMDRSSKKEKLLKRFALAKGRDVHARAAKCCCDSDAFVVSCLIDMYASCGSMEDAREVFERARPVRCVVSWTSLVLGYARNGEEGLALEMFSNMRSQGCVPDSQALVAAIKACAAIAEREGGTQIEGKFVKLAALEKGMAIYSQAPSNVLKNIFVASSLVDFYTKCGSVGDARRVFAQVATPDTLMWSTLLLGYAEGGEGELAKAKGVK